MDNDEEAVSINERKRKLNFFCFSEFIVRQHPPLHAIFSFDAVCDWLEAYSWEGVYAHRGLHIGDDSFFLPSVLILLL